MSNELEFKSRCVSPRLMHVLLFRIYLLLVYIGLYVHVCIWMVWVHVCHGVHVYMWGLEDNFWESILTFYCGIWGSNSGGQAGPSHCPCPFKPRPRCLCCPLPLTESLRGPLSGLSWFLSLAYPSCSPVWRTDIQMSLFLTHGKTKQTDKQSTLASHTSDLVLDICSRLSESLSP